MAKISQTPKNLYPVIDIPHIKNPNRFYAIPFIGGTVKIAMLIPVFIWLMLIGIAYAILTVINSLAVLFTGKYWSVAYDISVLFIKLWAKILYFLFGLTNRYPGFTDKTPDFIITIPLPTKPNRFFAIPLLGFIARALLLIPFAIYSSIMQYAANLAAIIASFPVLFTGNYPESLYELVRDNTRLNISSAMYFAGLSDKYPSFWISMHHKGVKILFIALAIALFLANMLSHPQNNTSNKYQQYNYQTPSSSTY